MNKHQLDRLFEEKLGAVQQEPSDKAKARFDQLLAQKHKKPVLIWWRVAAAVLLLAVSMITYLSWPVDDEQPLTADLPEKASQLAEETPEVQKSVVDFDSGASDQDINASEIDKIALENSLAAIDNDETASDNRKNALQNDKNAGDNDKTAGSRVIAVNDPSTAIAVADNEESDTETMETAKVENLTADEPLDVELSTEVAVAINEPKTEEAPKKKRLPVTIIYKSSTADQSLIAMQDIRDDVDSLADDRANSLKSILQNAGNGSILAEFKKAKEDLFNLDIHLKTKKVEN